MAEEREKDYTSGDNLPEEDEEKKDPNAFTEYNSKKKAGTVIPRAPALVRQQNILGIVCAAVAALYLFSFYVPAFRQAMEKLSPWNAVLSAALFAVSLFISAPGENRPVQLWLVSACVPAFHYFMVWALNKAQSGFAVVLLGIVFLVAAASLVFTLDHRVVGKNEFPYIVVLLPMYILAFSLRSGLAEYAPAWYNKALAFFQMLTMANALAASLLSLRRKGKKE